VDATRSDLFVTDVATLARSTSPASLAAPAAAWWALRLGAALCFIGHGAFGFITKAAWVPYFGVVGIPERWAWKLMPLVGAVDVTAGMAVLFAPRPLPLGYMVLWALWTALLRPLAGESAFETFERAGNYGVPAALLLWAGVPRSWRASLALAEPTIDPVGIRSAAVVLRASTALLLAGHGGLGAIVAKPLLAQHYAAIGLAPNTVVVVGWFELGLAAVVALRPHSAVLGFVACWKLGTESLFLVAGSPMWELIERAGSVAAPVALLALGGTVSGNIRGRSRALRPSLGGPRL
jgi:hypothetical protein